MTTGRGRGSGGRAAMLIFAVALAAGLLYYSLRGIDWRQVGRIVAHANLALLAVSALTGSVTLFLRAVRWRVLLNAEGQLGVPTVFWATAAGYFGNNFLPARGGEFVRTFMIRYATALDLTYVLATALSERVADAIALVAISGVVLLTIPSPPGWLGNALPWFAGLALAGALGIAILPFAKGLAERILEALPLPRAFVSRLHVFLDHGLRGMRAFHHAGRLSAFLALTAAIWYIDALGTVVTAIALGFHMPLTVALLLLTAMGLGSAVPSTPGYVGIYQFVAVSVLVPFGFSRTDAITYILVAQAMMYVVIGVWGAFGIARYRAERRSS